MFFINTYITVLQQKFVIKWKNEIYDVYKINNIYAKKSTITIVQ